MLSEVERLALYGLPDFDDFQRAEYFSLTDAERALVHGRDGLPEQVHCLLQIAYFKAKHAFFSFELSEVPQEDIDFLLPRYFPDRPWHPHPIRKAEVYVQRNHIVGLFGYRLWSDALAASLRERAEQAALRDVAPTFILTELLAWLKQEKLLAWLKQEKIVRPGYTTLQALISEALSAERVRLGILVEAALDDTAIAALQQLLVREDALSELAAIKQDAKDFRYRMMVQERRKRTTLEPLYRIAKALLPTLSISQQNQNYYASLVHFYTIYDLRRLKPGQTYLYLLCYVWQRYRQINDTVLDALGFHVRQMEERTKSVSKEQLLLAQERRQKEAPRIGKLLSLFVDDALDNATPFGVVRRQAYDIMPKEELLQASKRLRDKAGSSMEWRWAAIDKEAGHCKNHLRPLATALEFSTVQRHSPWLAALRWMKDVFSRQQRLDQRPLTEIPEHTIPRQLRSFLLRHDDSGKAGSGEQWNSEPT